MKVSDIMSDRVVSISEREPVIAAARLLKRFNLGALPVTDDAGRLRGMLTDRDIAVRCVASGADAAKLQIREIMSRGLVTAQPEDELSAAARCMGGSQVRRLPVVQGDQLVGMLSLCDMARHSDMEAAAALADISNNLRRKTIEHGAATDKPETAP